MMSAILPGISRSSTKMMIDIPIKVRIINRKRLTI